MQIILWVVRAILIYIVTAVVCSQDRVPQQLINMQMLLGRTILA